VTRSLRGVSNSFASTGTDMATAAVKTPHRPERGVPDPIEALLREILDGQRRILAALERVYGPRDAADVALLVAIAEAIGDRRWTCGELVAHAALSPSLHDALENADITNARDLGWFCRRLCGNPRPDIRLARAGASRAGALWCVAVTASQ
jgi:hypothetical protein